MDMTPSWDYVISHYVEILEKRSNGKKLLESKELARKEILRCGQIVDHLRGKDGDEEETESARPKPPGWRHVIPYLLRTLESTGKSKAMLEAKEGARREIYRCASIADEMILADKANRVEC